MAGVFAQAHVGHDEEVGRCVLHDSYGPLHDPVARVGAVPEIVFRIRYPKQDDGRNVQRRHFFDRRRELVKRKLGHPRHRRDRLPNPVSFDDEQGLHEVGRSQARLPHQ
jgi:hypothetical protein